MQVFTYSEVRQKLVKTLDLAESTGKVVIRRNDGRTYALVPEEAATCPLDISALKAKVTTQGIVEIVRKGRERG